MRLLISHFSIFSFRGGPGRSGGGPVLPAFFCDLNFCDQIKTIGLSPHPLQAIKKVHAQILDGDLSLHEISYFFMIFNSVFIEINDDKLS